MLLVLGTHFADSLLVKLIHIELSVLLSLIAGNSRNIHDWLLCLLLLLLRLLLLLLLIIIIIIVVCNTKSRLRLLVRLAVIGYNSRRFRSTSCRLVDWENFLNILSFKRYIVIYCSLCLYLATRASSFCTKRYDILKRDGGAGRIDLEHFTLIPDLRFGDDLGLLIKQSGNIHVSLLSYYWDDF